MTTLGAVRRTGAVRVAGETLRVAGEAPTTGRAAVIVAGRCDGAAGAWACAAPRPEMATPAVTAPMATPETERPTGATRPR